MNNKVNLTKDLHKINLSKDTPNENLELQNCEIHNRIRLWNNWKDYVVTGYLAEGNKTNKSYVIITVEKDEKYVYSEAMLISEVMSNDNSLNFLYDTIPVITESDVKSIRSTVSYGLKNRCEPGYIYYEGVTIEEILYDILEELDTDNEVELDKGVYYISVHSINKIIERNKYLWNIDTLSFLQELDIRDILYRDKKCGSLFVDKYNEKYIMLKQA